MMLGSDPLGVLALAHQRGGRLRAEAAAERLTSRSATRRVLAAFLRGTANRLDPAPFAWRAA
jgi:hypothetical protein